MTGRAGREHDRHRVPGHVPGHVVDLVAVRTDPTAPAGGTTVVRLLSLLPARWECVPRCVDSDRITLRIAPEPPADRRTVHRTLREVLADRALAGWTRER